MSAREIIAKRVSDVWGPTLGQTIPTAVMAALIEAGYRILSPGEIDNETVEACAKAAEQAGDTWSGTRDAFQAVQEAAVDDKCEEIADAIRSLGSRP